MSNPDTKKPAAEKSEAVAASEAPKSQSKRLVLVATNKGGVGKSTAIINIADYLKEREIPFVAFDPDHANASFARFFANPDGSRPDFMRLINIADDTSLDQITRVFDEEDANLVLVDGVGAQQETFMNWIEDIGLFERAKEMDLKITFVLVVDEDKDTVEQAMAVAGRVEDQVDYLVVKNLKNSEETRIYDGSAARKMLNGALSAKEITFPKLKGNLVSIIQSESMRLSEAATSEAVYVNDRMRFKRYRAAIEGELAKVEPLFTA